MDEDDFATAKHRHSTTDADKQHLADFLMIEKKDPFFQRSYREEPTADLTRGLLMDAPLLDEHSDKKYSQTYQVVFYSQSRKHIG